MGEREDGNTGKLKIDIPEITVGPLNKGLGTMNEAMTSREIIGQRWNLLHEDLSLPAAVLYEDNWRITLPGCSSSSSPTV